MATHQACYTRINAHYLLLLSPRTSSTSSSSSSLSSSSSSSKSCCLLKRRRNPTLLPPSRVSFACRAAKNSDENPFAALQSMRSHLADKPELAVKKEEKRTSTNIDEFAYEDENNTKKELTKKKATPPSPSQPTPTRPRSSSRQQHQQKEAPRAAQGRAACLAT